jgi:transposase
LVASEGNPTGYEIFEGNIFEGHTFIPVLQKMAERFSLGKPTVIADAGLLSNENIAALEQNGYSYILCARPKNADEKTKQKILSLSLKNGKSDIIPLEDKKRLIVSMSDSGAKKDAVNREKGLLRLQKRLKSGKLTKGNINNRGYNKYLKLEGEISVSINMDKYNADAAWDGLKAYKTNTRLSAKKVIENYGNLWYIERAFRMNKTDLRIRPIYHHVRNRIEGHICICFTACTVLLKTERMLKKHLPEISLKRAQELVKTMYQLTYRLPNSRETHTKVFGMSDEQQRLFEAVGRWCR